MRRVLAITLLATAGLATAAPAQATCSVAKVDYCTARDNVLRAIDCTVRLQPPCISY